MSNTHVRTPIYRLVPRRTQLRCHLILFCCQVISGEQIDERRPTSLDLKSISLCHERKEAKPVEHGQSKLRIIIERKKQSAVVGTHRLLFIHVMVGHPNLGIQPDTKKCHPALSHTCGVSHGGNKAHGVSDSLDISSSVPVRLSTLAQNLLELCDDRITHILSASAATNIPCPGAIVNGVLHSLLDGVGLLGEAERVPQHHGDGQDGADGVNNALARDIGCRS